MSRSVLAYGEILWDLLPDGRVLGGAPFNFAYRAATLGMKAVMVSRVGCDELGDRALEAMRELGMSVAEVQRSPDRPTGTVPVILSESGDPSFTIVADVAYDYIEMTPRLGEIAAAADCLCFGTLAQRSEVSRRTLGLLLERFGGRYRLVDINLRTDCYTAERVVWSLEHADILKMNDTEAPLVAEMAGVAPASRAAPRSVARELVRSYGLRYCLITRGEGGSYALSSRGEEVLDGGYAVRVRDTCGSGDAFTAAFTHGILSGSTLEQALRAGNALGAMVAMQQGATGPISPQELRRFMRDNEPRPAPPLEG